MVYHSSYCTLPCRSDFMHRRKVREDPRLCNPGENAADEREKQLHCTVRSPSLAPVPHSTLSYRDGDGGGAKKGTGGGERGGGGGGKGFSKITVFQKPRNTSGTFFALLFLAQVFIRWLRFQIKALHIKHFWLLYRRIYICSRLFSKYVLYPVCNIGTGAGGGEGKESNKGNALTLRVVGHNPDDSRRAADPKKAKKANDAMKKRAGCQIPDGRIGATDPRKSIDANAAISTRPCAARVLVTTLHRESVKGPPHPQPPLHPQGLRLL